MTNYTKGRAKEYSVRRALLKEGWDIVIRSAGSHSPVDLVAIDKKERNIRLIQCKSGGFNQAMARKLERDNAALNGLFNVSFEVI